MSRHHLCVNINTAIEKLKNGVNIFTGSPQRVMEVLTEAKKEGKTFYSGCDNMDKDGICAGHKD